MTKKLITLAVLLLSTGSIAVAGGSDAREKALSALKDSSYSMYRDEAGQRHLMAFSMATEWQNPGTQGKSGAIFADLKVNHIFTRRLTTGDFRQDLLVGFDSKANMRFAVLHGGISDSCEALKAKPIGLSVTSRTAKLNVTGGAARPYTAGTSKGCYVPITINAFNLRDMLNQSPESSVYFTLTVDGEAYPVFFKSASGTIKFFQTSEVLIARQNLAVVNPL